MSIFAEIPQGDGYLCRAAAAFQTAEQNRLIILFSFMFPVVEGTGRLSSFLHKLLGELGQSEGGKLTAGCSPEYREYTSAAEAYREALQILEMKKLLPYHTRELLLYEEIGFWAYLPAILEQKRSRPAGARCSIL